MQTYTLALMGSFVQDIFTLLTVIKHCRDGNTILGPAGQMITKYQFLPVISKFDRSKKNKQR